MDDARRSCTSSHQECIVVVGASVAWDSAEATRLALLEVNCYQDKCSTQYPHNIHADIHCSYGL
jgi:hypothetical protein